MTYCLGTTGDSVMDLVILVNWLWFCKIFCCELGHLATMIVCGLSKVFVGGSSCSQIHMLLIGYVSFILHTPSTGTCSLIQKSFYAL